MISSQNMWPPARTEPYLAPEWARGLAVIPRGRLRLARLPTPTERWRPPDADPDWDIWIKRDDLTGLVTSGNKIRKLEFLLAEALEQSADTVITCGGIQSNHARATAAAARALGLDCHLVLAANSAPVADPGLGGNLLLDRLVGARIHRITWEEYPERSAHMATVARELQAAGRRPFVIPEGGSSLAGCWGYIEAIQELLAEQRAHGWDWADLAGACGSGGTAAGLAAGVRAAGWPVRVHAVIVSRDVEYFRELIRRHWLDLGLGSAVDETVDLVPGYVGAGYGVSQPQELERLVHTARRTGVILDPVYTGKAFYGMISEMRANPGRFQGRRVLFWHTGGLFALFDRQDELAPVIRRMEE